MTNGKKRDAGRKHPDSSAGVGKAEAKGRGWRWGALTLFGAGGAYLLVSAVLLAGSGEDPEPVIGAVCDEGCVPVRLFGVLLPVWGGGLMALVLGLAGVYHWKRLKGAGIAAGVAALFAGGASLAFAGSQWIGAAEVCVLCQVASVLAFVVMGAAVGPVLRWGEYPALAAAPPLFLGFVTVLAVWPYLEGLEARGEDVAVAEAPGRAEQPEAPSPVVVEEEADGEDAAAEGAWGGLADEMPRRVGRPAIDPMAAQRQAADAAMAGSRAEGPPVQPIRYFVDDLVVGSAEAPFELVMLSDFDCNICRRFEANSLPELMEKAVATGQLRLRFLFTVQQGGDAAARVHERRLVAATVLARAGQELLPLMDRLREVRLISTPQGIAFADTEDRREEAMELLRTQSGLGTWPALVEEHGRLSSIVRRTYFQGSTATPLFLLMKDQFDPALLPPAESVYTFTGYQIAGAFLEWMEERK